MGKLISALARSIPLSLYPSLVRRDVVGLAYHCVSDERLPHLQHLDVPETTAPFEAALLYIQKHFQPVSAAQVQEHRLHGARLPERALHLSFDGGFAECYTVVRPLLLKHSIPCTFFVTSGWLDNTRMFFRHKVSLCIEQMHTLERDAARMALTSLNNALDLRLGDAVAFERWILGLQAADEDVIDMAARMLGVDVKAYLKEHAPYLTREQVSQLHADGFTIGAQGVQHARLAELSAEQIEREIVDSARAVQTITGQERVPFSFPYSGAGISRAQLVDIRSRHPFIGLLYDTRGLREDVPFILNRIRAGAGQGVEELLRGAYQAQFLEDLRRGPGSRDPHPTGGA